MPKEKDSKRHDSISAVILTYNGSKFLEKRIASILDQTVAPYEILVLDDASTDDSVTLTKQLLKSCKIPYRIITNEENRGCGEQLIRGIDEAKGQFIWFAEQDDYCSPNFIERVTEALNAHGDINLVYGQSKYIDATYGEVERETVEAYCLPGVEVIPNKMSVTNEILSLSGSVFRKTALEGIENYIPKLKVFYDWLMNAYALRGGFICYVPATENFFYRHGQSIIAKERKTAAFYEDLIMVKDFIIDHFDVPDHLIQEVLYEVDRDYRCNGHAGNVSPEIKENQHLGPLYKALEQKIYKRLYP